MRVSFVVGCLLVSGCVQLPDVQGPTDGGRDAGVDVGTTDTSATNNLDDIDQRPDLTDDREMGTPDRLPRFTHIAIANRTACAVERTTGHLWCWGANDEFLLEESNSVTPLRPPEARTVTPSFDALVAGTRHMCGLDGGQAYCWGRNAERQAFTNPTAKLSEPMLLDGTASLTEIGAGDVYTCGRVNTGDLLCWGTNAGFVLHPTEGEDETYSPTKHPAASGARRIAVGEAHACFLDPGSTAWCWGKNTDGRVAEALPEEVNEPIQLGPTEYEMIAASTFTCGVTMGSVRCWGANDDGQLGLDNPGRPLPGTTTVSDIALGPTHGCALIESGDVHCWGEWTPGETAQKVFRAPSSGPFLSIGTGPSVTCASTATELYCWGSNQDGLAGQFDDAGAMPGDFLEPTRVPTE